MSKPDASQLLAQDSATGHRVAVLLLWLGATVIGCFLSYLVIDAAYVDGEFVPLGNDSFYHARRMLDIAVGDRGLYQFDERIHVPDGSWVPWPWAYDYLMGMTAWLVLQINPGSDPMAVLSYIPVAWLGVNAALFLAATGQAGLAMSYRVMAMLAFAIAPFVQLMHMVGKVDHHFVEFTFVLLVTWLGLKLFSRRAHVATAICLGFALGLAPGFHNGLFILQIPVLVNVALGWLRGTPLEQRSLRALAAALLIATLVVVIPSEPFQAGEFHFGLLSWFHLYAAACTSVVLLFISWRIFDKKALMTLIGVCLLLVLPLLGQLLLGASFLSTDLSILEGVIEAMSPAALFFEFFGPLRTIAHYSWLLVLAPFVLVYFLWYAWRATSTRDQYFAVMTVFGLAMLLTQFRFNYFGLFALIAGVLFIVQQLTKRYHWNHGMVTVGMLAGILIAYQPPLRQHLFAVYAVGATPMYEQARPLFLELNKRCEQSPGVILADPNDGNYLLFHTECSVISNNFRLNAADVEKFSQISELLQLTPAALRIAAPDIRYILLRSNDFIVQRDGQLEISASAPLAHALLTDAAPPTGFELLQTTWIERDGAREIYARAYAIR